LAGSQLKLEGRDWRHPCFVFHFQAIIRSGK